MRCHMMSQFSTTCFSLSTCFSSYCSSNESMHWKSVAPIDMARIFGIQIHCSAVALHVNTDRDHRLLMLVYAFPFVRDREAAKVHHGTEQGNPEHYPL